MPIIQAGTFTSSGHRKIDAAKAFVNPLPSKYETRPYRQWQSQLSPTNMNDTHQIGYESKNSQQNHVVKLKTILLRAIKK